MLKDTVWNFFLKTGDVDTYLSYKNIISQIPFKENLVAEDLQKNLISR